ncbi:Allergen Asp f 7 [Penicillium riverlandense]|uniref:Allergen Asp f 7 n=1 Tax=Penicillium riverlandense TaxID=1903569 RepID=UPI002547923B|nr:Allergen Asp f 7 [Penicillium riverlandense]KAJ5812301.1 Allergen Asp f 7 [Penicillium riverlandense]
MAPITKTLALAGALFAASGVAAPFDKRAVVYDYVTDVVWTTIDVTTTIYPGGQAQPTAVTSVLTVVPASASPSDKEAPVAQATQAAPPAPAPPAQPTSSTTEAPAPAPTASSSSSSSSSSGGSNYSGSCDSGSPCTGDLTYYDTATTSSNPSSCGTTNDGLTESVLALPHGIMTDGDCGKTVTITYNGVTASGTVVDKCMGCDDTSIDLSRALFEKFSDLGAGRLSGATWSIE